MKAISKLKSSLVGLSGAAMLFAAASAFATPTLQSHVQGGIATTLGSSEEDTWVLQTDPAAEFFVDLIGNFGRGVSAIEDAYLVLTVPDGSELSINISLPDGSGGFLEPIAIDTASTRFEDNAEFESHLASSSGVPVTLNEHSPYGSDQGAVDVYGISLESLMVGFGVYSELEVVPDCNADSADNPDPTSCMPGNTNQLGETKTVGLLIEGADWAHVDLLAQVTSRTRWWRPETTEWVINPPSHDSTVIIVPLPSTALLFALGLAGLGLRRKLTN